MNRALLTVTAILILGFVLTQTRSAEAFLSPHPLKIYETGLSQLNSYQGDAQTLSDAQKTFNFIIEKHPNSPFGYLGMSQLKVIEAYRCGQRYNIKIINDEAMPMALKAMRAGPTLNSVHTNYDRFEQIYKNNDDNQDHVRRLLFLFPERADTYLSLGNYLSDQNDFEKAIEYYKVSLKFSKNNSDKLKALQRIAHVYLKELYDAKTAAEYYEAALEIDQNLPSVWEYLGKAYLQLKQFDRSVENLQKAFDVFKTPQLQSWLSQAKSFLFEEKGEIDQAIDAVVSMLNENTQNSSLHHQLANLYYKKRDYLNAIVYFQKVIESGVLDPETFYYAGRTAHELGHDDVAKDYYAQYLHLKGEGEQAEWIRQNIPDLSQR